MKTRVLPSERPNVYVLQLAELLPLRSAAAWLYLQQAQVLMMLSMPDREIAGAFKIALDLVREEEDPRFQRAYDEWKQSRKKSTR